jgi:adenine-specific DNA-methyltransferase
MPTLEWIGKNKVANHHRDVPYRALEHRYTYMAGGAKGAEIPEAIRLSGATTWRP